MSNSKPGNTFIYKIKIALLQLDPGDSFDRKEFISKHWHTVDEYTTRCFDVHFCHAKKELPDMKFKTTKQGLILRTL